jgi:glycosyltransferase involved in cell wall biosynthesis
LLILLKKYFYEHITEEANNIENYYNICNEGKLLNKVKFQKIENPKISVITSVYNQNQYILRFLRSIQNQFFDDIEIVFVDDCSKDNSVELIKKYQKEDPRIRLIKHKNNRGTLISRNDGIIASKGEYIMIPDVDDMLSENILYNCYETAKLNNYEMIRFNIYIGEQKIFFDKIVDNLENRPVYQPELTTYLFYGLGYLKQIDFNLSNKFIKRDAYIRALNSMNEFYLNQYMTNLEDGTMNYILYRTAKSFYFLRKIGYYYIQNVQSITVKPTENYDNKMRFIFIHWKFIFENTKNNEYEKNMANCIFDRFYYLLQDDFQFITKNFKFYYDLIYTYLNCPFTNKKNRKHLNRLKKILDTISNNTTKK